MTQFNNVNIEIKGEKFTINGEFEAPRESSSGKSLIHATTKGFVSVTDEEGITYKVALNIISKRGN